MGAISKNSGKEILEYLFINGKGSIGFVEYKVMGYKRGE
jgi:hypothetical protein